MEKKQFKLWNNIVALLVLAVSAWTYLSTIEPSASYWDCGEFIASSYKLEVGHPPGNPVFQLVARVFTMFAGGDPSDPSAAGNENAAIAVNAMSAICSALTIYLLYLTIAFFAKRLFVQGQDGKWSLGQAVAIMGSSAVGSLAYCFSDTFWFSAVEGEVYAMSSLFTALVFWAMTKWYEAEDRTHVDKWLVLISFLMGLSVGVHLLNLLAIPAIVFLYFYKVKEDGKMDKKNFILAFAVGVAILAIVLYGIIPVLPKAAAWFDKLFVNGFGCAYNVGATVFMLLLLAACFAGIFATYRSKKVVLNTVLLCFTTIVIGFSIFSVVIIRSSVKTPTNEYQPDNAYTLVRYLSREQYGKTPLVLGQYFDSDYDLESGTYWTPLDGGYKEVDAPAEPVYQDRMLFPRMWQSGEKAEEFYEGYYRNGKLGRQDYNPKKTDGMTEDGYIYNKRGELVAKLDQQRTRGENYKFSRVDPDGSYHHPKPEMLENMNYFLGYQMNWMYWRYFMWNFAGRQNEIHSSSPGARFTGNWESGIPFLDNMMLGDQSEAPSVLADNKGKNHYFLLPLILGLIGLFFQWGRDPRGGWLTTLMFFMTGIAIVLYLNQPPFQVRERDYAYAGSFYFFTVWIGLAVAAVYCWVCSVLKKKEEADTRGIPAMAVTLVCLSVPVIMACENWDDHDRSNRRTAVEMASNYLNSVGENGILVTHGDNDTFPLWYAQEVENVRTDVRICNTSLLGTDWHIDQMKYACNESAPLALSLQQKDYLYGTNEYVTIRQRTDSAITVREALEWFTNEKKYERVGGKLSGVIPSRQLLIPVNKENALKSGIVPAKFASEIPDTMLVTIPSGKSYLTKPELFMLDLLANYDWTRPLNLLSQGGDLNIGIKEYLMYQGYSYKLVPFKTEANSKKLDVGIVDTDQLYSLMTETFSWEALKRKDYCVDYQNMYTHLGVMSQRSLFVNCAEAFMRAGENDRALKMLDMCQENCPADVYPIETVPIGFQANDYMVVQMIQNYNILGCKDKAEELARLFQKELKDAAVFYSHYYKRAKAAKETGLGDVETLIQDIDGYYEFLCSVVESFNPSLSREFWKEYYCEAEGVSEKDFDEYYEKAMKDHA